MSLTDTGTRDGYDSWVAMGATFVVGLIALAWVTLLDTWLVGVWVHLILGPTADLELGGLIFYYYLAGALVPGLLVLLSIWLFRGRSGRRGRLLRVVAAVLVTAVIGNFFVVGALLEFHWRFPLG